MKKVVIKIQALLLVAFLLTPTLIKSSALGAPDDRFSDAELDELLAPIALYPDPLLAQVVPASTFIDELEEAQRVLGGSTDDNRIDNQNWDVSVKSVAHYPQILQRMVDERDWTTALGQAYVNQSTDVGKSIQRLRAEARAAGSLLTTSEQQVIAEGNVIRIVPAQPQVIYVPQYNPEVVYVNNGPSTGEKIAAAAITFGAGLAIGAWLNNDWDWRGRGIYYHGWVGGGWIGANRTFVNVNVNRNFYINNRYRNVNVNRTIVNRNIGGYRTNLNRNAVVRRNNVTRNNINVNNINRNNINRNQINRNDINRNSINRDNLNRQKNTARTNTDRPRLGGGGGGQQRTIGNGTRKLGGDGARNAGGAGSRTLGGGGGGQRTLGGGGARSLGGGGARLGGLKRHRRRARRRTVKKSAMVTRIVEVQRAG
ncbi:MAG TPA: DUF3300 domain-containing protein [Pyrinomonadaceae bacterium]|jgi:hypothetical protein|nr:DUF3300 domain-containing protein [Pyrinomonadaceae bacterium]